MQVYCNVLQNSITIKQVVTTRTGAGMLLLVLKRSPVQEEAAVVFYKPAARCRYLVLGVGYPTLANHEYICIIFIKLLFKMA